MSPSMAMLDATVYITLCSMRNRMRRWVQRLREPRYLFGLVAVLLYFYFAVFARLRTDRRARPRPTAALPVLAGAGPTIAGIGLLAAAAGSWLVPGAGRLFQFSRAEVQLLFPAPVTRRGLILHRLLRSQIGLLFAAVVPALAFALPARSGVQGVRTAMAIWLLLVAARVYFSAVTLARSQLSAPVARLRRMARLPLVLVVGALLIVGGSLVEQLQRAPATSAEEVLGRIAAIAAGGLPRVVLWVPMTLVQPLFAATWLDFARSMGWGLLVVAAGMVWVLASDEAFHDVTTEVLEEEAADRMRQADAAHAARTSSFALAVKGRPEGAFVWKTVTQALRIVDRRVIVRTALVLVALSLFIVTIDDGTGLAAVVGVLAATGAAYAVLVAPQIVPLDLRQDLQHLDLLKTWPVRASAIVRGQIMGPALLMTLMAWALVGLGFLLSAAAFSDASAVWRVSVAGAAALVGPALIFGQYTVHNALALFFPAWVALGSERARGLDAMGQRLLTLGATWTALILMTTPGALMGAVLWFAFYEAVGPLIIVPGAAVCAIAIGIEILLMTEVLGPVYEKLDLMSIERQD